MADIQDSGMRMVFSSATGADLPTELSPVPMIAINSDPIYVGENIIGSIDKITLTGHLSSINQAKKTLTKDGTPSILERIGKLRKIFNQNGCNLTVSKEGKNLIIAKGSKLISFNVDQTDNNWVNYATYTVELEFNTILYTDECSGLSQFECGDSTVTRAGMNGEINKYNKGLIDVKKYKIKSFKDSWSFELGEAAYQTVWRKGENDEYHITNEHFVLSYSLDAEGFHYYNDAGLLIPAWEQAKNFCKQRFIDQVKGIRKDALSVLWLTKGAEEIPCDPEPTFTPPAKIDELFRIQEGAEAYTSLGQLENYGLFDETINFGASEANGNFNLQYSVIIKKKPPNTVFLENTKVFHTIQRSLNRTMDNKEDGVEINIDGEIRGLVKDGGLIDNPQSIQIDKDNLTDGRLLKINPQAESNALQNGKYHAAINALNEIYIQEKDGNKDFQFQFKKHILEITHANLDIQLPEPYTEELAVYGPKMKSINIKHDYENGIITYQAVFTKKDATYENIHFNEFTITQKDPVFVINEVTVPGKKEGTVIQILNTRSPRTVSIAMNGYMNQRYQPDFNFYADNVCLRNQDPKATGFIPDLDAMFPRELYESTGDPNNRKQIAFLTADAETLNAIDGSFSINRTYTYYDGVASGSEGWLLWENQ